MREKISSKGIHNSVLALTRRKNKKSFDTKWILAGVGMLVLAALAACSPSTPTPVPTLPALPTVTGSTSVGAQAPGAAATSLDPCQLLPSQEASTLAGAAFGQGTEETDIGGMKSCTYSSQSGNTLKVEVIQAQDAATAQAQEAQFMAGLQAQLPQLAANGLNITQLPKLGDGGIMGMATIQAPTGPINGSAIGFVKGTTFFGFSDIVPESPAPTSEVMQSEAATVVSRLP